MRRGAYVTARTAQILGQPGRAAQLLADLAAQTGDVALRRQGIEEAMLAGRLDLALSLARALVRDDGQLPLEGRLLLVADALKRGQGDEALLLLDPARGRGAAEFLSPYLRAWVAMDRDGKIEPALAELNGLPRASPLAAYADEHRALLLLKAGLGPQAEPSARRAIGQGGARENRLRLAFADGYMASGDAARAAAMLAGRTDELSAAAAAIAAGRRPGLGVDNARAAFAELLLALAVDLNRAEDKGLPLSLARIAGHLDPASSEAATIAALMLEQLGRADDALALLAAVPAHDPMIGDVRDARARMLVRADRAGEAVTLAAAAVAAAKTPRADDLARLGDALGAADQPVEAGATYARALAALGNDAPVAKRWPLLLLRADQLEKADRWPESKAALQQALALAPDQAVILNFLGYAMLERGEDAKAAEAMIAKASALAPDNASITDSLGWAQARLGRLDEAIATLQRAAAADPAQAEIHEHLGDTLYRAGRRFEARHAWGAALLTANDEEGARLRSKLDLGLRPANAAP